MERRQARRRGDFSRSGFSCAFLNSVPRGGEPAGLDASGYFFIHNHRVGVDTATGRRLGVPRVINNRGYENPNFPASLQRDDERRHLVDRFGTSVFPKSWHTVYSAPL